MSLHPPPAPGLAAPPLTLHRTWAAGDVVRRGRHSAYRRLDAGGGEAHLLRDELAPGTSRWRHTTGRLPGVRSLLCLAHVTDLQLADVQSPARFEFFNREFADPRFADLVPVQRPQEALTTHAVDAMLRTLGRIDAAPLGGAPVDLVVTTGDAIDNAQWNELEMFLALMDGGLVRARSGGRRYEGVQSTAWPDEVFWRPDGAGPAGDRTSSARCTVSRTCRGSSNGPSTTSPRPGCRCRGWPATATTKRSSRASASSLPSSSRGARRRPQTGWTAAVRRPRPQPGALRHRCARLLRRRPAGR